MTLNDVLTKQNVFTKISLKEGDKELSKELKVKIMRIRMAYNKIRKNFDSELQEFMESLLTDEFKTLNSKTDKTSEEEEQYQKYVNDINSEYQEFVSQKSKEEVTIIDDTFNMNEYSEIVEVNAGVDVEINGSKVTPADFLEIIYDLFVKED